MESVQLEHENVTQLVLVSLRDGVEEGRKLSNEKKDPELTEEPYAVNATTVLSRGLASKGIYPAVDPLDSTSTMLQPRIVGNEHYETAQRVKETLQRYKELQDIIAILGLDELSEEDRLTVARARKIERFLRDMLFFFNLGATFKKNPDETAPDWYPVLLSEATQASVKPVFSPRNSQYSNPSSATPSHGAEVSSFLAYGLQEFNETSFDEWVDVAKAPALPSSLKLYNELKGLGFHIILLTGRSELQRNATEENLLFAGYHSWEKLILRQPSDIGKTAVQYKSERRAVMEAEGFKILGNSGDQWSDLIGLPMATRSFKLPNPMYFIS